MKTHKRLILPLFLFFISTHLLSASGPLRIWFNRPAGIWEEALPLGNGRIGAMPDGGISDEKIVLNDITLWSGSPQDADNPHAAQYLPQIRQLLLEGKNDQAQDLIYKTFVCKGKGSGEGNGANVPFGSYQMLANLHIINTNVPEYMDTATLNYHRELSLPEAIASSSYTVNKINYTREYFSSFADDVIVVRLKANKKGAVNLKLLLDRPERATLKTTDKEMLLSGYLNDGNGGNGMHYQAKMITRQVGGTLSKDGQNLRIKNADEVILFIAAGTNYKNPSFEEDINRCLKQVSGKSYDQLKSDHIRQYRQLFDRVNLDIAGIDRDNLPTDERLMKFAETPDDNGLATLYFQFGRYLLISSTRQGLLPSNLQGLWANTIQTPWNGDYHLNINVQMNHWPAEVANLPELHQPLIELTKGLVAPGERTASVFYNAQGWVAHMMTNPWGFTAPGEHPSWGATNTGGGWLCEHLWEHYLFNPNENYLKDIYPVLKGASRFFLDILITEPSHGWLVTAPSTSPENAFLMPGTRKAVNICMGPTIDNQILRELFGNTMTAARTLGVDVDFIQQLQAASDKLPPNQIGKKGQLMEWLDDYEEADPHHRHVSPLYGLHPSNQISPDKTPDLALAARATLEGRGDGGTGWSRAWKINFWARLGDGNRAFKLLVHLLNPTKTSEMEMNDTGGTYPNLFCAHPPFQIDGNLGGCAGIAEMLIQSHVGYMEFLPALPDVWPDGSFRGLRVRGGAEVALRWKNKRVEAVDIKATVNNRFQVKLPDNGISSTLYLNSVEYSGSHKPGEIIEIPLKAGETARLEWK